MDKRKACFMSVNMIHMLFLLRKTNFFHHEA